MCSGGSSPQKRWLCEPWSLGQLGELQWRLAKEEEEETADQGCWTRFLHPTSHWLHSGQEALTSWQVANTEMVMAGRLLFLILLQPLTQPFPALEVTVRSKTCGTHHQSDFITKATQLLQDRFNTTITEGIPTACLVYFCTKKSLWKIFEQILFFLNGQNAKFNIC